MRGRLGKGMVELQWCLQERVHAGRGPEAMKPGFGSGIERARKPDDVAQTATEQERAPAEAIAL